MSTTTNLLDVTIGQFFYSLSGMSSVFLTTGMTFAGLAFVLTAIGGIYRWWTSGSFQDLVEQFVRVLIILAPLLILFGTWKPFMQAFMDFFVRDIPGALGYSGGGTAVVGDAIDQLLKAKNALQDDNATRDMDVFDKIGYFLSTGIWQTIVAVIVIVLTALLAFGIMFSVLMPLAALYIGVIFGPLILPWLLWRPLSDVPARWVGFMIGNGMTFVVAVVIMKAMTNTLKAITTQLNTMLADGLAVGLAGFFVTLLALFAIYIFVTNIMLQANNMAQGMTGGATVGEGLFGKLSAAAAAGGMMAAAKTVSKGVVGGAAGGMKTAAKTPGAAVTATGKIAEAAAVRTGSERLMSKGTSIRNAGEKMSGAANAVGNVLEKSPSAGLKDIKNGTANLAGKAGNAALNHIAGLGGNGPRGKR